MRIVVVLAAALALAAPAHADHPVSGVGQDAARGLHYDGLVPAREDGPCRGVGFEFVAGGRTGCTHGPDPAPAGVDVRESPSVAELRPTTEAAAPVSCVGDGTSGPRVQALYVYGIGGPSRFSSVEPQIQGWAAEIADIVRASAFGGREVRFVTSGTSPCRVDVRPVAVSSAALVSFDVMIDELYAQGYRRGDRKYLVWADATRYCGIAAMYPDSRPGQLNLNNGGGEALVARVDSGCWSGTAPAHELVHTLGAVQGGAPNATAYGHCTDEYDVMCYADGPGTTLRFPCQPRETHARRLDCNGDDYFNVAPAPGSWLALNWNTANSAWLERATAAARPDAPAGLRLVGATSSGLVVEWDPVAGANGYQLYVDDAPYPAAPSTRATLDGLACGRSYTVGVEAIGVDGTFSSRATLQAATQACPDRQPPTVTARAASGRRGRLVRLRYVVLDADATSERITVRRGRRTLRTIVTPLVRTATGRSVLWRVPRTGGGPLRFCVRATDRSGNTGATRCAPIRLA